MSVSVSSLLRRALPAAAAAWMLGTCSLAQAGVLSFGDLAANPAIKAGSKQTSGSYWFESFGFGATTASTVGAIVDGSTAASCPSAFSCPVGNASNYYAALNDGYLYFGLQSGGLFQLKSLQASVIGAGQSAFPNTAGALLIQGFNAMGQTLGNPQTVFLPGLNADGDFTFANYALNGLASYEFSFVRIYAYACNFEGNCSRTSGLASVGLDNLVTTEVPEPGTLALIGVALAGMGLRRRRNSAAS